VRRRRATCVWQLGELIAAPVSAASHRRRPLTQAAPAGVPAKWAWIIAAFAEESGWSWRRAVLHAVADARRGRRPLLIGKSRRSRGTDLPAEPMPQRPRPAGCRASRGRRTNFLENVGKAVDRTPTDP
jgi:hypothetical protein